MGKTSSFGSRLRQFRVDMGLRVNELERRAGLASGHVSRLENGQREPSLETARLLARALGKQSLACWD